MRTSFLVFLLFAVFGTGVAYADEEALFANARASIFQIQLIEKASGQKSGIGSGFRIRSDGLIATNFHVIANAIHAPDRYGLIAIDHEGNSNELSIVDIDLPNDLALVRTVYLNRGPALPLNSRPLEEGASLYSIGNPRDLGMTMVSGNYNGLQENSFHDRYLYSGTLNEGMSGGPALDHQGRVVAINVATAGDDISFLVPAKKLEDLVALQAMDDNPSSFTERIVEQLDANQARQMEEIFSGPWPTVELGQVRVAREISAFANCWGGQNGDDEAIDIYYVRCYSGDSLYLSESLSSGGINYEFYWMEASAMNSWQFYQRISASFGGAQSVNNASADDVAKFDCVDRNLEPLPQQSPAQKVVVCTREYVNYPGLYDVILNAASTHDEQVSLVSHFAVAGVSQANAMEFTRRFLEHVEWTSL